MLFRMISRRAIYLQFVNQLVLWQFVLCGDWNAAVGQQCAARLVHGIADENASQVNRHVILEQRGKP